MFLSMYLGLVISKQMYCLFCNLVCTKNSHYDHLTAKGIVFWIKLLTTCIPGRRLYHRAKSPAPRHPFLFFFSCVQCKDICFLKNETFCNMKSGHIWHFWLKLEGYDWKKMQLGDLAWWNRIYMEQRSAPYRLQAKLSLMHILTI